MDVDPIHRLPAAFAELAHHLSTAPPQLSLPASGQRNTTDQPTDASRQPHCSAPAGCHQGTPA
jgi:hypothetical protein